MVDGGGIGGEKGYLELSLFGGAEKPQVGLARLEEASDYNLNGAPFHWHMHSSQCIPVAVIVPSSSMHDPPISYIEMIRSLELFSRGAAQRDKQAEGDGTKASQR
jgi:hypothetical protein